MEMDVSISKIVTIEPLMTISAGSYGNVGNGGNNSSSRSSSSRNHNNNNNNDTPTPQRQQQQQHRTGCYGLLSRLLCTGRSTAKTASSSADYNNLNSIHNGHIDNNIVGNNITSYSCISTQPTAQTTAAATSCCLKKSQHRRTPQEIYFESRGKSCKKLLKFNGNSNKILLYPEEGWARTASSSYWTITPCWWQPNYCRIEEISGTQRQVTKAKMFALEQQGSLLIAGHFDNKQRKNKNDNKTTNKTQHQHQQHNNRNLLHSNNLNKKLTTDEFKLYLSSNVSMEDYNMGYCLTGFVERRCQQTNTFQMTHFAVIKRQWPSIHNTNETKST